MPPAQDTVNTPSSSESKFSSFLPLQVRAVQRKGAVHAHLLVHGEHRLDGRMYQRIIRQDRQDHGHGNAVVAAQRRLVRPDPLPVGHQVKSLAGHVLGAVVGLGAHHVDVSLQDDRLGALMAGRCRLPDHHVVARLLPYFSPSSLAKSTHRSLMIFVLPLPWGTEHSFSKYANTFSGFKPFKTAILILLSHAAAVSAPPIQYSISACRAQASPYAPTAHAFAWAVYAATHYQKSPRPISSSVLGASSSSSSVGGAGMNSSR